MYLLIDLDNLLVLHRHESNVTLGNLAHIEASYCSTITFDETNGWMYCSLPLESLKQLYSNICGQPYAGSRQMLVEWLIKLGPTIEPSPVDAFEAYLQAASIPFGETGQFHYVAGSNKPGKGLKPGVGVGLKGNLALALAPPISHTNKPPPVAAIQAPKVQTVAAPPTKYAPPWL